MLPWHNLTQRPPTDALALDGLETLFKVQGETLGLFAVRGWGNDASLVRELWFDDDAEVIDAWGRRYSVIRGLPIREQSAPHTPHALNALNSYITTMLPKLSNVTPRVRPDLPTPSALVYRLIRLSDDDARRADAICQAYNVLRDAGENQGWPLALTYKQIGRLIRDRNAQHRILRLLHLGILESVPNEGKSRGNAYQLPSRERTTCLIADNARATSDWRQASLLASALPELEHVLPRPSQGDGPTWWRDKLLPNVNAARWTAYMDTLGLSMSIIDGHVTLSNGKTVTFSEDRQAQMTLSRPMNDGPLPTVTWRELGRKRQAAFVRCPVCGQVSLSPITLGAGLPQLHWTLREPVCPHDSAPTHTGTEEDARWAGTLVRHDDAGVHRLLAPFR